MKKFFLLLVSAVTVLFAAGCRFDKTDEVLIDEAREMIKQGQAECVMIKDQKIMFVERGHGVSPLLNLYHEHGKDMEGSIIVDKVIGRAAACIAINGKAKFVHGEIMSEDASMYLYDYGVEGSYTEMVPRILNRKRDGLCPLEQSVQGITNPPDALAALEQRVAELQAGMKK